VEGQDALIFTDAVNLATRKRVSNVAAIVDLLLSNRAWMSNAG
jgi:hypothetical protein